MDAESLMGLSVKRSLRAGKRVMNWLWTAVQHPAGLPASLWEVPVNRRHRSAEAGLSGELRGTRQPSPVGLNVNLLIS